MLYGSIHPKGDLAVDPNDIHYRELNITGTFSHDKESFREAVAMLNRRPWTCCPSSPNVWPSRR